MELNIKTQILKNAIEDKLLLLENKEAINYASNLQHHKHHITHLKRVLKYIDDTQVSYKIPSEELDYYGL